MFTINLENALTKQNKNTAQTPRELLVIKEYERLGSKFCSNEVIERVGLNAVAKEGRDLKKYYKDIDKYLNQFNQEKVFHISQIESLCRKYRLRFLSVKMYKGGIDKDLAKNIVNFEVASGETCTKENCMIAAPKSSFRLEARPKDPLFFYKLNSEYFYLIHKWGNDLSIFRTIKIDKVIAVLMFAVCLFCLLNIYFAHVEKYKFGYDPVDKLLATFVFLALLIPELGIWYSNDDTWNSNIE